MTAVMDVDRMWLVVSTQRALMALSALELEHMSLVACQPRAKKAAALLD